MSFSLAQSWKKLTHQRACTQPASTVMLSAHKWLWISRLRPWGWRERKKPLVLHPPVVCDPAVGWFVPPFHLPRCGCSTVPSPAFHGGTQLCRSKRSIPDWVRWDRGGCGFVVCIGIFFWVGKGLFNMFLAQIPFKQFLLCWIQVLLESVRFFLCLSVQKHLCVRHVYIPLPVDFSSGLTLFIVTDISNMDDIFKSNKGKNLLFYKEKPPSSSRPRP